MMAKIGEKWNETGGLKTMRFNFVVLQGMVNGGVLLGSGAARPAGIRSLTPLVSKCWAGVGAWAH